MNKQQLRAGVLLGLCAICAVGAADAAALTADQQAVYDAVIEKLKEGAKGPDSVAIGKAAKADGVWSTAIGKAATASDQETVVMGANADVSGDWSTLVGARSSIMAGSSQSSVFGALSKVIGSGSAGAFGAQNSVQGSLLSYTFGYGNEITGSSQSLLAGAGGRITRSDNTVGIGTKATVIDGGNSVAIGGNSTIASVESVAVGAGAVVKKYAFNSVVIGQDAYIGQKNDPGTGKPDPDASQENVRVGRYVEESVIAPAGNAKYAWSTVLGADAKSFGAQNTALGAGAEAQGNHSIALGSVAIARGHLGVTIGNSAATQGNRATAVGAVATSTADDATALGAHADATIRGGVALGFDAKTTTDKGVWGYDVLTGAATTEAAVLGANAAAYQTAKSELDALKAEEQTLLAELNPLLAQQSASTDDADIKARKAQIKTVGDKLIAKRDEIAAKAKTVNGYVNAWQATDAAVAIGNADKGTTRQLTGLAAGREDTDAVNVAQLKALDKKTTTSINALGDRVTTLEGSIDNKINAAKITVTGDDTTGVKVTATATGYQVALGDTAKVGNITIAGKDGGQVTGLTNTTLDAADFATKGRAATEEQLQAAMAGAVAGAKTTVTAGDNIVVTADAQTNTYTVSMAKDITADSLTAGGVTVGKGGIDAAGKTVTGLAAGNIAAGSTDAVTGGQLHATNETVAAHTKHLANLDDTVSKLGGDMADLRNDSRAGDAMSGALAALKPLDFDPLQRSQVMAGISTYDGRQAVALGLAHYASEDTLVHGGIAYAGSSKLMANLGISWRFGDKEDRDTRKARADRMPQYAAGPMSSVYVLQDEVTALKAENAALKAKNDAVEARMARMEAQLQALLSQRA